MSDSVTTRRPGAPTTRIDPSVVVVDGPLALATMRLEAARQGVVGRLILTLPQLAAHLAGGFARPATSEDLELALGEALAQGGFSEIAPLASLPGMLRATMRTLERLWEAGVRPSNRADDHARIADVALLDARVRSALTGGARVPPDLVEAALARRAGFPRFAPKVVLKRVHHAPNVWRPLLEALAEVVPVSWEHCVPPADWQAGRPATLVGTSKPEIEVISCANPQAEVVEALRWARELVAGGRAAPAEIAIAAASP